MHEVEVKLRLEIPDAMVDSSESAAQVVEQLLRLGGLGSVDENEIIDIHELVT